MRVIRVGDFWMWEILCSWLGAGAVAGVSMFVGEYPSQNGRVGNYEHVYFLYDMHCVFFIDGDLKIFMQFIFR